MSPFYTPGKYERTKSFQVFSGGIKWENWPKMGKVYQLLYLLNGKYMLKIKNKDSKFIFWIFSESTIRTRE